MAVQVYGSSGPAIPFIATFPIFSNPFDAQTAATVFSLFPSEALNGPPRPAEETSLRTGCNANWKCVQDLNGTDGAASYVTLDPFTTSPPSKSFASADLLGTPNGGHLEFGVFDFWCRGNGTPALVNAVLWQYNGSAYQTVFAPINQAVSCPADFFVHASMSFEWTGAYGSTDGSAYNFPFTVEIGNPTSTNPTVLVSTFRARLTVSTEPTGCFDSNFFANIGCQLGQFWDIFVKVVQFGVNIAIYIGGWILFGATEVADFFAVVLWLYTLPNAPAIVQLFIDVPLTALIVIPIFHIARLVRGVS